MSSSEPLPSSADSAAITARLLEIRGGDPSAMERLFPLVYEQLRRIAHNALRGERTWHTLATTDLVHEAYLKLVDLTRVQPEDRRQFFALAATAMRRILVDYARKHGTLKRGGERRRVVLDENSMTVDDRAETLVALDEALDRLGALDPRLSRVVECRFFGGLTEDETAEVLDVTSRTVRRDWVKAKDWLYHELSNTEA